jgi:hypothetical protein
MWEQVLLFLEELKKMLFQETFKINVVINGDKTKTECNQHFSQNLPNRPKTGPS